MMGDQAKSDVSPRLSKRRRRIAFDSNADGATDSTNTATSGPKLQEDNGNHINDTDVPATDADGDGEEAVDSVNATVAENWATRTSQTTTTKRLRNTKQQRQSEEHNRYHHTERPHHTQSGSEQSRHTFPQLPTLGYINNAGWPNTDHVRQYQL